MTQLVPTQDPPKWELTRPIVPSDELTHIPVGAANWRENWWLTFFDHARKIRGVVYANILPGRNHGIVLVKVFEDESPLFILSDGAVPIQHGDHERGRVGPVAFQCLSPLQQWRIRVDHPDLVLDLTWDAMGPAYDWDWGLATTSRHFEQPGRVTGILQSGESRISIDGFGQRDRAWGHRDPGILRDAWSSRVFFADGDMQHASIIRAESDTFLFGFVLRDGRADLIEQLELTITPAYAGGPPLRTDLHGVCGSGLGLAQCVDLVAVIPVIKASRGASTNQFFTFSEFRDSRAQAVGQLDYWWTAPRDTRATRSSSGNRGRWVAE